MKTKTSVDLKEEVEFQKLRMSLLTRGEYSAVEADEVESAYYAALAALKGSESPLDQLGQLGFTAGLSVLRKIYGGQVEIRYCYGLLSVTTPSGVYAPNLHDSGRVMGWYLTPNQ